MSAIRPRLAILLALAAMSFVASPLRAAPCVGFTDVDDQSPFCKNVEWLKNRAITLGCTTTNVYCPNQEVTRLSMSAFLNRLGNALTPVVLTSYNTGGTLDIDASPLLCSTVDQTPTFPRTVHGIAVLGAGQGTGDKDFAIGIVESTNSGATWTPVSPLSAMFVNANIRKTATVILPPRDLAVGTSYRWGIRVSRVAGSTTVGDPGAWHCQFQARLENRVTQTPPFDDDE